MVDTALLAPISQIIQASVDEDMTAFLDAWAPDALLSDSHRKYWGREAIRRWGSIEWMGDHVRVTEVRDHTARGEDIRRIWSSTASTTSRNCPRTTWAPFFSRSAITASPGSSSCQSTAAGSAR
jgi:hypothetical protein